MNSGAKEKKDLGPTISFEGMTSGTHEPCTRPHLSKVPLPLNSATLRTKPLTHGSLEDIQHPTFSRAQPKKTASPRGSQIARSVFANTAHYLPFMAPGPWYSLNTGGMTQAWVIFLSYYSSSRNYQYTWKVLLLKFIILTLREQFPYFKKVTQSFKKMNRTCIYNSEECRDFLLEQEVGARYSNHSISTPLSPLSSRVNVRTPLQFRIAWPRNSSQKHDPTRRVIIFPCYNIKLQQKGESISHHADATTAGVCS
jgi:hypothetical protein